MMSFLSGLAFYVGIILAVTAAVMTVVICADWSFKRVPYLGYAVGGLLLVLWVLASISDGFDGHPDRACEYGYSGLNC